MKLMDLIKENSGDLKNHRDRFMDRWKKIMKAKSRKAKLDYAEKLLKDMLTNDEIRFFVIQLQKNK